MKKPEGCGYCTSRQLRLVTDLLGVRKWICPKCGWFKVVEDDKED